MPSTRTITQHFIYFRYCRRGAEDVAHLRKETEDMMPLLSEHRNVVLDLTALRSVNSSEINQFMLLARRLMDCRGTLHIIPGPEVKHIVQSLGVAKLGHVTIHDCVQAFSESIKRRHEAVTG